MDGKSQRIYVWDYVVRVCHVVFILGVISAFVSYQLDYMEWHVLNGYVVLGALALRILWGFIGPSNARFSHFLVHPSRVYRYLRHWRAQPVPVGHNPLGGYAVVALLLVLAGQATSGLFADDEIMTTGPLAEYVSHAASQTLTELHEINFFFLLLPMIALHITAALVYLRVKKTNLIKPMITGYKTVKD